MLSKVFPIPEINFVSDSLYACEPILICDNELVAQTVSCHHFNEKIQIVLPFHLRDKNCPDRLTVSSSTDLIQKCLPLVASMINGSLDNEYRYIQARNVPLHFLVHPKIIKSLIHKGSLLCTSFDNSIVTDDCVALADGILRLSLTDKSYYKLGFTGSPSILAKKKNPLKKFNIELDLFSDHIQNTVSKYSKRLRRLFRASALSFDILIKWHPKDSSQFNVDIDFIADFLFKFMNDPDETIPEQRDIFSFQICSPEVGHFTNTLSRIPKTISNIGEMTTKEIESDFEQLLSDITDWTGIQMTQCDVIYDEVSSEISSFGFHSDLCDPLAFVHCLQLKGFFSPSDVDEIVREAEKNIKHLTCHMPFFEIIVHGFKDCAVSWAGKGNEHGCYLSGENLFGILLSSRHESTNDGDHSPELIEAQSQVIKTGIIWRIADSFDFALEKI